MDHDKVVSPTAWPLSSEWQTLRRGEGTGLPGEVLVAHQSVSRRPHLRIRFDDKLGVAFVEDLGRATGTQVDGAILDGGPHAAAPGAVLRVGEVLFVISAWTQHPFAPCEPGELPADQSYPRYLAERLVDRASEAPLHVMLLGPTGAGKERLAARYHDASARNGMLVPVNCAGIPEELFASELFGHTKGAYSGAKTARGGLWARAQDGTLFLDEVAELPAAQQSAILRALDSGLIRPVGGDSDIQTDVRVISATSRDPEQLEGEGRLRSDLIARLAGMRVELPGLAARREEILPLFRETLGPTAPPLTSEAAERLLAYEWPKNVRELVNAAKVVSLFVSEVSEVSLPLLPEAIRKATTKKVRGPDRAQPDRAGLEALLETHSGNVERIAKELGVGRATVHRWMTRLALKPQDYRRR